MRKKLIPSLFALLMGAGMVVSCSPKSVADNLYKEPVDDPVTYEEDDSRDYEFISVGDKYNYVIEGLKN